MATSGSSSTRHWARREQYVAALMETNDVKMSARTVQEEHAIFDRARELFNASGDHIEEEQAMDDAHYALRALKSCLELHGGFATVEWQSGRPNLPRSDGFLP